nr:3-phosphoserine/phosphohydroxythreonine transaminase [Bacillus subtilis]
MERTTNFNAGPAMARHWKFCKKHRKNLLILTNPACLLWSFPTAKKEYEAVHQKAKSLLIELMGIPEDYDILFLQGGASLQFSMLPMNFLTPEKTAHFVMTGAWSEKALAETKLFGNTSITATSETDNYSYIPEVDLTDVKDGAYLHITSNNTIFGTQWQEFPNSPIPLVADMSSDILSRKIDVSKFDVIYGGAQKNLGPSGVTVVIMKKSWSQNENANVPKILKYSTHVKADSLYNTPPTFAIYMLSLVLEWLKENGGVEAVEQRNEQKAQVLYSCIDESNGFYKGHARKDSRSRMNVTFTLRDDELTKTFVQKAKDAKMIGLGGHRSVGGRRASIYNAVSLEDCEKLVAFMKKFQQENE